MRNHVWYWKLSQLTRASEVMLEESLQPPIYLTSIIPHDILNLILIPIDTCSFHPYGINETSLYLYFIKKATEVKRPKCSSGNVAGTCGSRAHRAPPVLQALCMPISLQRPGATLPHDDGVRKGGTLVKAFSAQYH